MAAPRRPHGNRARRLAAGRFDHAANALAMPDLRAKAEVARRRFDIDRAARGLWLRVSISSRTGHPAAAHAAAISCGVTRSGCATK